MNAEEVYASECCGGVYVPGYGPDNIVDLESELRSLDEDESLEVATGTVFAPVVRHQTITLTAKDAQVGRTTHEAVRLGHCPACDARQPLMRRIHEGDR